MSYYHERRSGKDRRQNDVDLMGKVERRHTVESRKPEITELQLSDNDWKSFFGTENESAIPNIEISVIIGHTRH